VKKEIKIKGNKKFFFFYFKVISANLNTIVESLKKFLTVSKGLQGNSVQFDRHVCLNVFSIRKPLSFVISFQLRKEKDAVKKTGIVLTSLDGALA
jgi:hypothetical protein